MEYIDDIVIITLSLFYLTNFFVLSLFSTFSFLSLMRLMLPKNYPPKKYIVA